MNIHPLFVHFPVALLVVYALMEITPRVWTSKVLWWRSTKIFLLMAGWLATIPTLITGSIAGDLIGETKLVETHEMMATITVALFAVLVVAYLAEIFESKGWDQKIIVKYKWLKSSIRFIEYISKFILQRPTIYIIAFIGMALMTITGGLGASIAYGPDFDPIVSFIYGIFF